MIFRPSGGVIFRCEGSFKLGLGHLSRCAVLRRCLAPEAGAFAIRPDPVAESFLKKNSIEFRTLPAGDNSPAQEASMLVDYASELGAKFIVLDKKDNSRELLEPLSDAGLFLIDLEDRGPGRDLADILIDPHIQPSGPEAAAEGQAFCGFGPDWAILHPLYAKLHKLGKRLDPRHKGKKSVSEIVIACGGSDPAGLSSRVLKTLDRLQEPFRIKVVSGPGARRKSYSCRNHQVNTLLDPPSLARTLHNCELAVVSGGITMLESLCLRVPTVVVPQHEEQFANAERFAAKGALLLAPPADNPAFEKELENIVSRLLSREELRAEIAQAGWSLVDGKGVQRLKSKLKSCKVAKWQSGKGKARHKGT